MIGESASPAYGSAGNSRCRLRVDFFTAVACAMWFSLEQVLPLPCHPFLELAGDAAVAPRLRLDRGGSLDVGLEALLHLARETGVEDDQVGLIVMDKAAPVEVRRADARPA